MTKWEKARIILEEVDKELTVASYLEDEVLQGIMRALTKIEKKEVSEPCKESAQY